MMQITYTTQAQDDLRKLPISISERILAKMDWYVLQENPLSFAKRLAGSVRPMYRFRVGDYRTICRVDKDVISFLLVLSVKHRKEAYKHL